MPSFDCYTRSAAENFGRQSDVSVSLGCVPVRIVGSYGFLRSPFELPLKQTNKTTEIHVWWKLGLWVSWCMLVLPFTTWLSGLNSGSRAWRQTPLPAEAFTCPRLPFYSWDIKSCRYRLVTILYLIQDLQMRSPIQWAVFLLFWCPLKQF